MILRCPRCEKESALFLGFGALREDVCARCFGRFLSPSLVERVIVEELGIASSILRDLAASFTKHAAACPSCRTAMRTVSMRGMSVDLCTGCGGAWIESGKLQRLSHGRHEELSPVDSSSASSKWAVMLERIETLPLKALLVAFDGTLTRQDAVRASQNNTGIIWDGMGEVSARRIVERLTAAGFAAAAVDDEVTRNLPAAIPATGLEIGADALDLGKTVHGDFVQAAWDEVTAISVGEIQRALMAIRDGASADVFSDRPEVQTSSIVTSDAFFVDVICRAQKRRYRVPLATLVGAGGSAIPRHEVLRVRLNDVLLRSASVLFTAATQQFISGGPPPRYPSRRDFDRAQAWLLWKHDALSAP